MTYRPTCTCNFSLQCASDTTYIDPGIEFIPSSQLRARALLALTRQWAVEYLLAIYQ